MQGPEILKIHHVAILTSNELYEKSKNFYTEVLGFKIIRETFRESRNSYKLDLAIQDLYQIELFSFPDFRERGSYPECKGLRHLSFLVKDLEQSVRALNEKGVITEPIRTDELTQKRFTFFEDPNHQPLEIYEL
jgi:glyoxylase I family protein